MQQDTLDALSIKADVLRKIVIRISGKMLQGKQVGEIYLATNTMDTYRNQYYFSYCNFCAYGI